MRVNKDLMARYRRVRAGTKHYIREVRLINEAGVRMAICAIFALMFLLCGIMAGAQEIDPVLAVRAIIGEASNQGARGMLAVACGIRNRGHLRGVYGVRARHIDREPQYVWDIARRAWAKSARVDIVSGATHWESTDFDVPYWARDMVEVARVGKHIFYKEE